MTMTGHSKHKVIVAVNSSKQKVTKGWMPKGTELKIKTHKNKQLSLKSF